MCLVISTPSKVSTVILLSLCENLLLMSVLFTYKYDWIEHSNKSSSKVEVINIESDDSFLDDNALTISKLPNNTASSEKVIIAFKLVPKSLLNNKITSYFSEPSSKRLSEKSIACIASKK